MARVMKRVKHAMRAFKLGMLRGRVRMSTIRKIRAILDEALAKIEDLISDEGL
jgi:hypothetical protein